jgi:hypothetical protein
VNQMECWSIRTGKNREKRLNSLPGRDGRNRPAAVRAPEVVRYVVYDLEETCDAGSTRHYELSESSGACVYCTHTIPDTNISATCTRCLYGSCNFQISATGSRRINRSIAKWTPEVVRWVMLALMQLLGVTLKSQIASRGMHWIAVRVSYHCYHPAMPPRNKVLARAAHHDPDSTKRILIANFDGREHSKSRQNSARMENLASPQMNGYMKSAHIRPLRIWKFTSYTEWWMSSRCRPRP